MTTPTPAARVDLDRARAFWAARQGLAAPDGAPVEEIVARSGWLRTLGGIDAYLALRARKPELSRAEADAAVEARAVQVVPAVRGCIYLVPAADVPVALRLAEAQHRPRSDREMAKLGVPQSELEELGQVVLEALAAGPMTPDQLRRALPAGAARSLGEAGKKMGVSSTLPTALRHLEFAGRVERRLEGGRLDTERYLWALAPRSPFDGAALPDDRLAWLAERFFRFAGPATLEHFAGWAEISKRDATAAVAAAPLAPVAVDGFAEEAWLLAEDLEALEAAVPDERFALIAFEDNLVALHGGPAPLADARHHALPVRNWGRAGVAPLGESRHIHERAIVRGGRLVGWWEYHPDEADVVWSTFDPLGPAERGALEDETRSLAAFVREELGHARSYSLDTDAEVRDRAARIRAAAA